jgi:hypothetical protein
MIWDLKWQLRSAHESYSPTQYTSVQCQIKSSVQSYHYVFTTLSIQTTWPCKHDTLKSMNMIYMLRYILLRESRHVREFGTSGKTLERYTDPNITSVKSWELITHHLHRLREHDGPLRSDYERQRSNTQIVFPGYDIIRLPTCNFSQEDRGGRGWGSSDSGVPTQDGHLPVFWSLL